MEEERVRSFVAVDLDEPGIRDRVVKAQARLERTGTQLKPVNAELMHLTLRFLGEIPLATLRRVEEAMGSLEFSPFEIELSGLGAFPSLKRINVIWIGIISGHEELDKIFHQLEPKLRQIGVPGDSRGFNPHLTIARVKASHNREALAECITLMQNEPFGKMQVAAVRLKKSVLTPKGPIYSTLHEARPS